MAGGKPEAEFEAKQSWIWIVLRRALAIFAGFDQASAAD